MSTSGEFKISIRFFGHFEMTDGNHYIDENTIRSTRLLELLAYLTFHRTREVSISELSELLWSDEEIKNPEGALKNLVYRLRALLKKEWQNENFIITNRGTYAWNPDIPLELDTEAFDQAIEEAEKAKTGEEKTSTFRTIFQVYRGNFLARIMQEYWVASQGTYYHSKWLTAVKVFAQRLEDNGEYDQMIAVLNQAIQIEDLDEDFHCFYCRALNGKGAIKMALEHYREAEKLLYEQLGVSPSENLQTLYLQLMKQTNEKEMNIKVVHNELEDEETETGAFYCAYGVFKRTLNLEQRRLKRLGIAEYMVLVTITPILKMAEDDPKYLKCMADAAEALKITIGKSLREGDIYAQYSGTQFVMMLPTCQYESAKKIANRIETNYQKFTRKFRVKLIFGYEEIA